MYNYEMRWVTKEADISVLIQYGKDNLSSENYLFVTTKDMLDQTKENLEVFCPQIKPNQIISGFVEKINKKLVEEIGLPEIRISERALAIFLIKKELINIQTLENFTDIDEKLLPIIQIINSFDYKEDSKFVTPKTVKRDLDWFKDRIHVDKITYTEHNTISFVKTGEDKVVPGELKNEFGYSTYDPPIGKGEMLRPLSDQLINLVTHIEKNYQNTASKLKIQLNLGKLATKIDPENYFAHEQLGSQFLRIYDYDNAISSIEKSLEINPKYDIHRTSLADCYFLSGKLDLALHEILKLDERFSKRSNRDKFRILAAKAKIKFFIGDLDGAELDYQKAHEIYSSFEKSNHEMDYGIYFGWYKVQHTKRDHKMAIEVCKIGLMQTPGNAILWENLAFQYSILEQTDKALDALERAYDLDKNEPSTLMALGIEYLRKDEKKKALKIFQEAKPVLEKLMKRSVTEKSKDTYQNDVELLNLAEFGIHVIENNQDEEIEKILSEQRKIQNIAYAKQDKKIELPKISIKERRNKRNECRDIIQQYIRKKFDGDPNKLKSKFRKTFEKALKSMEEGKNSLVPRKKNTDLFSYLDFGDFPYIVQNMEAWNVPRDVSSILHISKNLRNVPSHFDGEDEGELDQLSAEYEYIQLRMIIRYFESEIGK